MGNGERFQHIEKLPRESRGNLIAQAEDVTAFFGDGRLELHPDSSEVSIEPIEIPPLLYEGIDRGWKLGFHVRSCIAQAGVESQIVNVDRTRKASLHLKNLGTEVIRARGPFALGQFYIHGEPFDNDELRAIQGRFHLNGSSPEIDYERRGLWLPAVKTLKKVFHNGEIYVEDLARGPNRLDLHAQLGMSGEEDITKEFYPGVYLSKTDVLRVPDKHCLVLDREDGLHLSSPLLKPGYEHEIVLETHGALPNRNGAVGQVYRYMER